MHKYIELNNLPTTHKGIDWSSIKNVDVYFEYDDIKDYIHIVDYSDKKLTITYKDKIDCINTSNFRKVKFGKILNIITKAFKLEIGTIINDTRRNLTIIDRKLESDNIGINRKYYKYKCNKCPNEDWIEESNLLSGKGCNVCNASNAKVLMGYNDIATTAPWMVKYLVDKEDAYKYTHNSSIKIKVKCPDCGKIKGTSVTINNLYKTNSIGCTCSDKISYPEKFLINILEQLNIDFVYQLSKSNFKWCGGYRYDFYLKDYNIIIETHGEQHYRDTQWRTYVEQHEIDVNKKNLALNSGVSDYIEIDCRKSYLNFIQKSVLNSNLIKYFDFDNIDWISVGEYASKNLAKEVCKYYEENKLNMLIKDMINNFNISDCAFRRYIKIGNELGWCKFEEKLADSIKQNFMMDKRSISVKCIELNKCFSSLNECRRYFKHNLNTTM